MIYITGTSGFVGQHLTDFFSKQGIGWTSINLRDSNWQETVSLLEDDVIIHLAGKAHDHKGIITEEEFFQVNTELTKVIYQFFLKERATVFIHISTIGSVNELGSEKMLTEDSDAHPVSSYGKSKRTAEQFIISNLSNLPQKKTFILRPSMIHGPGDKGNLALLYKAISSGIPYVLGSYNNKRSFLSIDNFVFILKKIIDNTESLNSGIYNVVDDEPVSTNQIINLMTEVKNKKARIWKLPKVFINGLSKVGDFLKLPLNTKRLAKMTSDLVVSNDKIKKALNIKEMPIAALDGLRRTIASFSDK